MLILEILFMVWKVRGWVRVLNLIVSLTFLQIIFRFPLPFLPEHLFKFPESGPNSPFFSYSHTGKMKTLDISNTLVSMEKRILFSGFSPQDLPLYLHAQISLILKKKSIWFSPFIRLLPNLSDFHTPLSFKNGILWFLSSSPCAPFNQSLNIVIFAVQIALLLSILWGCPSFSLFIFSVELSFSLVLLSPVSSSFHLSSHCCRMVFPVQTDRDSLHCKKPL